MVLSRRLSDIVSYVTKNDVICDVGCDHGLTSIYCLNEIGVKYAILSDIAKLPLQSAIDNLQTYAIDSTRYDTRLGSGISTIEINEVSCLIITGMGANLIVEILEADLFKVKSIKHFVFQATKNDEYLRNFLNENGFRILDEKVCVDYDIVYHTIHCEVGSQDLTAMQLKFGYQYDLYWQHTKVEMLEMLSKYDYILSQIPNTYAKYNEVLEQKIELETYLRLCEDV